MNTSFKTIEAIEERDEGALDSLKKRLISVAVLVLFFFALVVSRLWFLQITKGGEYEKRAYGNRVRIMEVAPPRGHILDRFGREIVTNRPAFNVVLVQEDSHDLPLGKGARSCRCTAVSAGTSEGGY